MTFIRNFPTFETSFETLVWGQQYPSHREVDFACRYVSGNEVEVGSWSMNVSEALQFIEFYQRHDSEEGPCGLQFAVTFTMTDPDCRVPDHVTSSVVTWLKHALGVERYDGPFDENWED